MIEAAIGALTVRQRELTGDWNPCRAYDHALVGVSWESRGASVAPILEKAQAPVTLMRFRSREEAVDQRKDQQQKVIEAASASVAVLPLSYSTDAAENCARLEAWMREAYVAAGRPLRLLVDITCLPKTYLLFLLGLGFTRDYVACFDCHYAAGKYDLAAPANGGGYDIGGPRELVSEGEWRSHQVPYLEASDFLPAERDLIVGLGGELGLSLPFIERFEPRRLGLIFISETAPTEHTAMLRSERSALDDMLREPNAQRVDIPLGNVVEVGKHAAEFAKFAKKGGVTGLAIGSKTHALGLGIAALASRNMEIVCRTPASYKPIDVHPTGRFFFYEIEDRFDPCSYL
jgi:hypothetical protein